MRSASATRRGGNSGTVLPMETPEYERQQIVEYLQAESGSDFSVEHVEKLASEYVLGQQYDVWDAHTNEGRWWVITPPANLYSQDQIKSMDIALSFHIGLMTRVMARDSVKFQEGGKKTWVLEVLRRLETAAENLNQAREIEDVQAVGMRLREALLTLTDKLRALDLEMPIGVELPAQNGNFKGWAEVFSNVVAPGASAGRLRKILKSQSDCTWEYLGWLTHARNASMLDGQLAYNATNYVIEMFLLAVARIERGPRDRCPECSSYQLSRQHADDAWLQVCGTCDWSGPTDPPRPIEEDYRRPDGADTAAEGECIPLENFSISLTPGQARKALGRAASAFDANDDQPRWSNRFAVRLGEENEIHDVHRMAFSSFNHEPALGAELTYECAEEDCVNPQHAAETPLPAAFDWRPMIVESVRIDSSRLELQVANQVEGRISISIEAAALDRFGIGDASSLLERVIFVSGLDSAGTTHVVPAARRASYENGSAISAQPNPHSN